MYELISMEDMPPKVGVHPKYEFMRASFDGCSSDGKKIVEIKVPGEKTHDDAKAGIVPPHYMIQIQHQLLVSGADSCDFFSYSYKDESHALIEVFPNLGMQVEILSACINFWENHVLKSYPPPLTSRDVKEVYEGEIVGLCEQLKQKDSMKKQDVDSLKAKVIELGGHNKIRCGDVLISETKLSSGKMSYRMTTAKQG